MSGRSNPGSVPDLELGIVIPTLDEAEHLGALLDDLAGLPVCTEVVVVDGGSRDATLAVAASATSRIVCSPPGRARQMNRGGAETTAPWLLFLHADTRLPPATARALADFLEHPPEEEAAYFRFGVGADGIGWRLLERVQSLRERLTGLAYGDQGLLLSRRRWREMGGFPEIPVMEDVAAIRALRRTGGVRRLDAPLQSSPRRYLEEGVARTLVRNTCLISLYLGGVHPHRLARWYRPRRAPPLPPGPPTGRADRPPILMIFVKAPRPGEVKTRLARDVGAVRAAAIYRTMGRRIVDRLRGGPYRTIVHFSPPDALEEIQAWLGEEDLEFRSQVGGSLGARMAAAFDVGLREADQVCVVGTDSPDLTAATVRRAMEHLAAAGEVAGGDDRGAVAVVGPALDGGYYLLGLDRPTPSLFRDIPWGTAVVLGRTLRRAHELGIPVHTLEPLADVDQLADVPPALLREKTCV